jgi:hypothetical protein
MNLPWRREPRIEDPIRLQRFHERTSGLSWSVEERGKSLRAAFNALNDLAYAEVRYYFGRRQTSRGVSFICRLLAWAFAAVGLLLPLIRPVWSGAPDNLLAFGYLAFGIAGSVLVFNSVFIGSEGHRRFVTTQLDVERLLTLFRLDWLRLTLEFEDAPSTQRASTLLARAVTFTEALYAALGTETAQWGKALTEAVADLDKRIQGGSADAKSGKRNE